MALADLMKKGFLTSATATPATFATHRHQNRPSVATVADVAVANPQNAKSAPDAGSLALFRFDLVQAEIDAGYPVDELHRVNNIAWRLITTKGYPFDEAITAAALWVANNAPHDDEAGFVDVMELFKRVAQ